jgi:hypothetical protein
MERFCGILQPWIKSRRFPFANLDNHVVAMAQILHIKIRYNLHEKLSRRPRDVNAQKWFSSPNCEYNFPAYLIEYLAHVLVSGMADPTCMLLHPHVANPVIDNGLFLKILVCLATRYNKTVSAVRRHLSVNDIELWGKVQIVDGGDTMVASSLVKNSQDDSRNATYVRVSISYVLSSSWRLVFILDSNVFSTF